MFGAIERSGLAGAGGPGSGAGQEIQLRTKRRCTEDYHPVPDRLFARRIEKRRGEDRLHRIEISDCQVLGGKLWKFIKVAFFQKGGLFMYQINNAPMNDL